MTNFEKFITLSRGYYNPTRLSSMPSVCFISLLIHEMKETYDCADIETVDLTTDAEDGVEAALEKHIEKCTPYQLSSWEIFYQSVFDNEKVKAVFLL